MTCEAQATLGGIGIAFRSPVGQEQEEEGLVINRFLHGLQDTRQSSLFLNHWFPKLSPNSTQGWG